MSSDGTNIIKHSLDAIPLVLAVIFVIYIGIIVIGSIILAIGHSNLFMKAGRKWWEALIPFLNSWRISQIAFGEKLGWTSLAIYGLYFIPVVGWLLGSILQIYRSYKYAEAFTENKAIIVCYILFTPIVVIYWAMPNTCEFRGTQYNILNKKT